MQVWYLWKKGWKGDLAGRASDRGVALDGTGSLAGRPGTRTALQGVPHCVAEVTPWSPRHAQSLAEAARENIPTLDAGLAPGGATAGRCQLSELLEASCFLKRGLSCTPFSCCNLWPPAGHSVLAHTHTHGREVACCCAWLLSWFPWLTFSVGHCLP